jgi:hypothetical protein
MAVDASGSETFLAGAPKVLFTAPLATDPVFSSYSVSADGQRFLMAKPVGEAASPTLTVVLNWPAAAKKGPPQ